MGELSKAEAARYLGCSPRQVERLTGENKLGVRYVKGRGKPVPRYDDGELARFKAEQQRAVERPAVQVLEARAEPSLEPSAGGNVGMRRDATAKIDVLSLPVASQEQMQVLAGQVLSMLLQQAAQINAQLHARAQSDEDRRPEAAMPSLPAAPRGSSTRPQAMLGEKLTLSLDEAAALSGVPRSMLRTAIQSGELQARKIGRGWKVRRKELERWVKATC